MRAVSAATVLIMAAGQGTRMRSAVPKVLHPVAGRPMVRWVFDALKGAVGAVGGSCKGCHDDFRN